MTGRSNKDAKQRPVRHVTVDAESANRRLDNFLLTELKGLPRTRIYSMIRKGEVRVNKGRARAATRLAEGDRVRIPPVTEASKEAPLIAPHKADWILKHVVHEDEHLLALDKPAGLAVHGGSGVSLGAIELLRAARPGSHFLELVHRLDRETSGCLLVAKKRSALRKLHEEFRGGTVNKYYRALLLGDWQDDVREVDMPLLVEHRQNGERHVQPGAEGKPALTRFRPEQRFAECILINIELLTGRTHQIRVHAAAIGHPVAGDEKYGEGLPGPAGLDRLFLHACRLEVAHPSTGVTLTLEAPLGEALQKVLEKLQRE
ncbi:MAG: RluA family pseudouridine synthase [Gammaproteobacteria bacterium]|jgi:23S rRNA pseudouridine955/2504/2580 synthase|nr:RluA family pseudouridine synthase [Gammaproteobacteria bacterium]MDP6615869.1 RluA family pseudouridine synthase [Gammaproteobacteria bacterium]MDP6694313.1 RluA family pseudouridine synthase [Gammaproteobacteria bacterium]MDP7041064.1 RluA family pseudouridine synthase [Gammaproteobacteria bacterium]